MNAARELDSIEATGLIRLAVAQPELEYLFRHGLVQEATYASLVRQERRRIHVAVAEALEGLYPERRRELAGVIALHLEQAGETVRAVPYLIEAGRHAAERQAVREAFELFDRAYRAASEADPPTADMQRARAVAAVERVKVGWTFAPPADNIALLEVAIPIAEEIAEPALLGDAHYWSVFTRQLAGQRPEDEPALARSIKRLEELGASGDVAGVRGRALVAMGMTMTGHLREGVAMAERAVQELQQVNDPVAASAVSQVLAFGHTRLGDFAASDRALAEARRLAEESGDAIAKLDLELSRALIAFERGDLAGAESFGASCARGSEELGAVSCAIGAHLIAGGAQFMRGDIAQARARIERSRQLTQTGAGFPSIRLMGEAMFAGLELMTGAPAADAQERWNAALEGARGLRDPYIEASILQLRAMSLMQARQPEWGAVLADLEKSAAMFEEMGARTALAQGQMAWGQALTAAGRPEEGAATLERGAKLAAEIGLRMPEEAPA